MTKRLNVDRMRRYRERAAPRHCGRGVCAAMEGHDGTCAEASGWDDEPLPADVLRALFIPGGAVPPIASS